MLRTSIALMLGAGLFCAQARAQTVTHYALDPVITGPEGYSPGRYDFTGSDNGTVHAGIGGGPDPTISLSVSSNGEEYNPFAIYLYHLGFSSSNQNVFEADQSTVIGHLQGNVSGSLSDIYQSVVGANIQAGNTGAGSESLNRICKFQDPDGYTCLGSLTSFTPGASGGYSSTTLPTGSSFDFDIPIELKDFYTSCYTESSGGDLCSGFLDVRMQVSATIYRGTADITLDPVFTFDAGFLQRFGLDANSLDLTQDSLADMPLGTGPGAAGAVPEPASWAMLLVGFGVLGALLRRASRHGRSALNPR